MERWKSEDIARLVRERFPEIGRYYVSNFLKLECQTGEALGKVLKGIKRSKSNDMKQS